MTITTLSSREFSQNANRAKEAAKNGPVFITDEGQSSYVLLSIEDFRKLSGNPMSLGEALRQGHAPEFDFTPPRAERIFRVADLD